tara:strand:- start:25994 stop:26326 length:333 start_codon:yes stop_codon:yes gene_type:complete
MRYSKNNIFKNEKQNYKQLLKSRGISSIRQYDTSIFRHPTVSEIENFSTIEHIWGEGDRYFKLASEHYSDPKMWWVIGLFNKKPTESHLRKGDVIYIPFPLEAVLPYLGY